MTQKGVPLFTLAQDAAHGPVSVSMRVITALPGAVSPRRASTMTSRRHFMAICFGLAAWFWCTGGAFAQERPASPQPHDAGRPAVVVVPSDFPWDTVEWIERRYKIEAMRFKARDESGWDWPGSDEVMVGTFDAKGHTTSNEIGDIDSGETHHFEPAKSCILAVRPGIVVLGKTSVCTDVGEPAPLSFRTEFWEKDDTVFGFSRCLPPLTPSGFHGTSHCLDDGEGDDFLGHAQVDLSIQELEMALPQVGDQRIETVVLNPCPSGVCDVTYGPDYSFTYAITRLPDVRVGLHGVLDEAMRKIGARSEIEAIAAGLRSLRAPSPRKIEPETVNPPPER